MCALDLQSPISCVDEVDEESRHGCVPPFWDRLWVLHVSGDAFFDMAGGSFDDQIQYARSNLANVANDCVECDAYY